MHFAGSIRVVQRIETELNKTVQHSMPEIPFLWINRRDDARVICLICILPMNCIDQHFAKHRSASNGKIDFSSAILLKQCRKMLLYSICHCLFSQVDRIYAPRLLDVDTQNALVFDLQSTSIYEREEQVDVWNCLKSNLLHTDIPESLREAMQSCAVFSARGTSNRALSTFVQ